MSRYKAALVHFLISVAVFSVFLFFVFFIWYAYPFNITEGVADIVYLMAGIDVVLGPLLTLVIFKAAKKGLKFDLFVIGVCQIAALIYGGYVIYSERPAWIVHVVDRIEVVGLTEVNSQELLDNSLDVGIFDKPRWVYAQPPVGEEANDLLFSAVAGGADIDRLPKYYRPYSEHVSEVTKSLIELDEHSKTASLSIDAESVGYLPVIGKTNDVMVLLSKDNAEVVDYVNADPWAK